MSADDFRRGAAWAEPSLLIKPLRYRYEKIICYLSAIPAGEGACAP